MHEPVKREYDVEIMNVIECFCPSGDDIRLLYVLKGSVALQSKDENVTLHAGDVRIFNLGDSFLVSHKCENLLIKVTIAFSYLARYIDNVQNIRFGIGQTANEQFMMPLRGLIARLAVCTLQDNESTGALEMNAGLSEILRLLMLYFRQDAPPARRSRHYSARVAGVLNHIHARYRENLSLNQMAQQSHTSLAYLSRLFTREVGVSFKHYLTRLRFEHGVNALLQTDRPLYQIAQDNGFSSVRNFTQWFKQRYGVTPHRFRAECREGRRTPELLHEFSLSNGETRAPALGEVHAAELLTLLANSLKDNRRTTDSASLQTENIRIALGEMRRAATLPQRNYVVSVGTADELLKSDIQHQIAAVQRVAPLGYVEVSHLISGESILPEYVSDEAFPSNSPYDDTDRAIGFLQRRGIAPLVRIHFDDPTQDVALYQRKLLTFLSHNINVFGPEYVARWCFICYPDGWAQSNPQAFIRHYVRLRTAIRQLAPTSRCGIFFPFPADDAALDDSVLLHDELVRHLDFLGYSANPNEHLDFSRFNKEAFDECAFFVQRRTQALIQQLKKRDLTIPLFLQAWNTLTGDTRHTNGSFFRGALLLSTLLELPEQVASVGFWINARAQNETCRDAYIDTSSLSLFYVHNTCRPIFHVLSLRERMQGQVLAQGDSFLITGNAQGYRVLLTHSVAVNPYLSLQHHLANGFKKALHVVVEGIVPGTYQIKQRVFDQQHGALYSQFERQHTRYGRDEEVLQWIRRRSAPDLDVYDEEINGAWQVFAEMDINAVRLFELKRVCTPPAAEE